MLPQGTNAQYKKNIPNPAAFFQLSPVAALQRRPGPHQSASIKIFGMSNSLVPQDKKITQYPLQVDLPHSYFAPYLMLEARSWVFSLFCFFHRKNFDQATKAFETHCPVSWSVDSKEFLLFVLFLPPCQASAGRHAASFQSLERRTDLGNLLCLHCSPTVAKMDQNHLHQSIWLVG